MTEAEHTPGSWEVTHSAHGYYKVSSVDTWEVLASMPEEESDPRFSEMIANAYKMAAAPELLRALEDGLVLICGFGCRWRLGEPTQHSEKCDKATRAIRKAKGE